MTIKSSCNCNIQDNRIEITSVGGGYFGEYNSEIKKVKLNLSKTLKSHLGYLFIWLTLTFAFMVSLSLVGLLVSVPLRLFNVDVASLSNWFYNIFRFGKFSNILASAVLFLPPYITNAIQAYRTYNRKKKHMEYKLSK